MALTLNSGGQAESVVNIATFTVTTDATAAVKTYFHCGFLPRYVLFMNVTDRIRDEFWKGMTADTSIHTVANGTVTLAGSGGITLENGSAVTVALSVVMPDGSLVLTPPASGTQYVQGFSVPAALMLASKTFSVTALG
jgi:hypothetical protein